VRAFARTDAEIEREIRDDVVTRTLWLEEDMLELRVEHGEVRLSGEIERRTDAELLPVFVERVPGVVSVRSDVTWAWDDRKASPAKSDPDVPLAPRARQSGRLLRRTTQRNRRLPRWAGALVFSII
jgi:hypothetical protein